MNARKFRLARIWSNNELKKFTHLFRGAVINVSAGDDVDKMGGCYRDYFSERGDYFISNCYPGSFRGYKGRKGEVLIDLEKGLADELINKFDVVLNHTTMEHIFDVFSAFKNLCRLSKDIVILVVPFVQEQHDAGDYKDYWRFTPECIRELFALNNFTVIYESCNNDFNVATYLFFIASRKPDKWDNIISYSKIKNAGSWIGVT